MSEPAGARLLLVDGHNVAYRAFHAIRGLTAADGTPTNALFGFIRILSALCQRWSPSHVGVCFDGGLPPERLARIEAYKAQRPPMPEALRRQIALLEEYLDLAAVARARREGCEADDLLAGLAADAAGAGAEVLLATSDKDLLGLVGGRVRVVSPVQSGPTLDAAAVEAKTGVPPALVPEWLAMTGDTSDNIPGVPGIGPKTAAGLLRQFGSLGALWERLAEVEPERVRAALAEHRATVERNLEVVRLRPEAAAGLDWRAWTVRAPAAGPLAAFCERYALHSVLKELREPRLL